MNPSVKNGYIPIANELAEQFARQNITGEEWRILWVVLRKTWGYKNEIRRKDFDWISITQFEKATGMKRANCHRVLKRLLAYKLIAISSQANGRSFYGLNQDYSQWVLAHKLMLAHKLPAVSSQANETVSSQAKHKRKKENIQKKGAAVPESILEVCMEHGYKPLLNVGLIKSVWPRLTDDKLRVVVLEIMAWREQKKKTREISTTQILNWLKNEKPEVLPKSIFPPKGVVIYS